eukprot:SAG11_NODE_678_length_7786_cov_10.991804_6_plen_62_part_00
MGQARRTRSQAQKNRHFLQRQDFIWRRSEGISRVLKIIIIIIKKKKKHGLIVGLQEIKIGS